MRRNGEGFAITVKVRLMHAQVRKLLLQSGKWREDLWSLPINQHDMLATVLLFSSILIDGYRTIGFRVTTSEAECLSATLRPGSALVCAGYCMYSSSTVLVLTLGDGVNGFTLDPQIGEFVLTHPGMRIPPRGKIYSFNEGNSPDWDPALQRCGRRARARARRCVRSRPVAE